MGDDPVLVRREVGQDREGPVAPDSRPENLHPTDHAGRSRGRRPPVERRIETHETAPVPHPHHAVALHREFTAGESEGNLPHRPVRPAAFVADDGHAAPPAGPQTAKRIPFRPADPRCKFRIPFEQPVGVHKTVALRIEGEDVTAGHRHMHVAVEHEHLAPVVDQTVGDPIHAHRRLPSLSLHPGHPAPPQLEPERTVRRGRDIVGVGEFGPQKTLRHEPAGFRPEPANFAARHIRDATLAGGPAAQPRERDARPHLPPTALVASIHRALVGGPEHPADHLEVEQRLRPRRIVDELRQTPKPVVFPAKRTVVDQHPEAPVDPQRAGIVERPADQRRIIRNLGGKRDLRHSVVQQRPEHPRNRPHQPPGPAQAPVLGLVEHLQDPALCIKEHDTQGVDGRRITVAADRTKRIHLPPVDQIGPERKRHEFSPVEAANPQTTSADEQAAGTIIDRRRDDLFDRVDAFHRFERCRPRRPAHQ